MHTRRLLFAIGLAAVAFAPAGLAQTPSSETAYQLLERPFPNGALTLFGTFFIPSAPGPHPGVVFMHGSGTSTRDNRWYVRIAEHLAESGIAVLLPDKRGSGKSEGSWEVASFRDLATDAAAGVAALSAFPSVASDRIGVLGVSQGGHVAPMVPQLVRGLAFVVNVSGSAVPLEEQLWLELTNTLGQEGWPRFMIPMIRPVAVRVVKRRLPEFWKMNGTADPIDDWRALRVPALVVYGAEDENDNVPVRKSVERLRSLSPRPAEAPIDVVVYPDSGHALYAPGTRSIRDDFLARLAQWIRDNAASEARGGAVEPHS